MNNVPSLKICAPARCEFGLCITVCHQGRPRLQVPVPTWKEIMCSHHCCNLPFPSHRQQVEQTPHFWPRAGEAHGNGWQGVGPEKWTRCESHYSNRGVVCQKRVNSKEQRTPAWGCVRLANQTWAPHLGNSSLNYAALCYAVRCVNMLSPGV